MTPVELSADRLGRVTALHVSPGRYVTAGERLVTLETLELSPDVAAYERRLERLAEERRAAEAGLEAAQAAIAAAQASRERAELLVRRAEKEADQGRLLDADGLIARVELEARLTRLSEAGNTVEQTAADLKALELRYLSAPRTRRSVSVSGA